MLEYADRTEISLSRSRVGSVKDLGPAYCELYGDDLRLVFLNERAINPFFALAEYSWIISGSKDLRPLQYFIRDFIKYSDDEITLNGAYGYRLRKYNGIDQIEESIKLLSADPFSRRVVLTIWSNNDLGAQSNDLPCNTALYLKIRDNKLDVTVLNRSNDLFMGVPYNIFTFYLLQVYISMRLGLKVGIQRHYIDSLHLYEKHFKKVSDILKANNKSNIGNIFTDFINYDITRFLNINHKDIIDLKFNNIHDETIAAMFKSYQIYKNDNNFIDAVALLPYNLLGFIAYQWYRKKKEFSEGAKNVKYENIISMMKS